MSAPSIEDEKYYTGDISGKKHVFRADVQSSLDHSILIAPSMAGSPMAIEPFSTRHAAESYTVNARLSVFFPL